MCYVVMYYWCFFYNMFQQYKVIIRYITGTNICTYEWESVDRLQIGIKRKIYDIRTCGKTFISLHILHQHWYTGLIALPVSPNPQPLPHLRFNLFVIGETFATKMEPLYMTNTSHRKHETFHYGYALHWVLLPTKKAHNRTLLFGSTFLKNGRHFHYRNQPLNMCMRVCYLDCHEVELCCYLVIHIENLLLPLKLFHFHLLPIYWFSLV
jgi:hypothetical protein